MEKQLDFFVEDTEKVVAVLGYKFLKQYIEKGKIQKYFAVLTQKRVYFKGVYFIKNEKEKWVEIKEDKIIDLNHVKNEGFNIINQLSDLIFGSIELIFYYICMNYFYHGINSAILMFSGFRLFIFATFSALALTISVYTLLRFFFDSDMLYTLKLEDEEISFYMNYTNKEEIEIFQAALKEKIKGGNLNE